MENTKLYTSDVKTLGINHSHTLGNLIVDASSSLVLVWVFCVSLFVGGFVWAYLSYVLSVSPSHLLPSSFSLLCSSFLQIAMNSRIESALKFKSE